MVSIKMQVVKRDGRYEDVSFDKILARIECVRKTLNLNRINSIEIAKETIQGLYNGISTAELDTYAANKCADRIIEDPQYDTLAAGITISNLHKMTPSTFMDVTDKLFFNSDMDGKANPLITEEYYNNVKENIDIIEKTINYKNDYLFDFFAIKTLERSYLFRLKDAKKMDMIVERPQHMIMRVALGIHCSGNPSSCSAPDIGSAMETYNMISEHYFTHASPTLFNAGTKRSQMSSCFLLNIDDNIEGIFDTVSDVAFISKWAGGIGIHLQNIRAKGSLIRGTNGCSDGIVPLIKLLNSLGRYINQGGRRNGAIACYLSPWHADIYDFCDLRKNNGVEELRARDIFLGLWVPDIFYKRVQEDGMWSLMCPDECPGLTKTYGEEFEKLYMEYEKAGKYKRQVKAKDLFDHIMNSQLETGMPYMLNKDNANRLSNQKNVGVLTGGNLCAEIIEYCDSNEIAVCNLASICLPTFIKLEPDGSKVYDYKKLAYISGIICKNLNKVIEINFYPTEKAKQSNMRHRPIGIGVQGLANVFCMMDVAFDSEEAIEINKKIFESIYYGALRASIDLAKRDGPYETFEGSPFSEGNLQFHLWGLDNSDLSGLWDWDSIVEDIKKYGTRNSLLTTIMPTASTAQIMGFNESTEPFTTNLYTRSTLAGDYTLVNNCLVEKLISMNLWTTNVKNELLYDNGSIQKIQSIPDDVKNIYKTAYEMKIKPLHDLAISRGPFIDQTQSMNIFMKSPSKQALANSHFYAWKNNLKTGMYYLRSQPAVDAFKFGLDMAIVEDIENRRRANGVEIIENTGPKAIQIPTHNPCAGGFCSG